MTPFSFNETDASRRSSRRTGGILFLWAALNLLPGNILAAPAKAFCFGFTSSVFSFYFMRLTRYLLEKLNSKTVNEKGYCLKDRVVPNGNSGYQQAFSFPPGVGVKTKGDS
jgi:hypothetical protein